MQRSLACTNDALLPAALKPLPGELFMCIRPRHLRASA